MFKVGDKVRVKKNLKDIFEKAAADGEYVIETSEMADMFAGKIGVVQKVTDINSYIVFGYYWKEYSLEGAVSDSISGYKLLL